MGRTRAAGLLLLCVALLPVAAPSPSLAAAQPAEQIALVEPNGCWHLKRTSGPDYTFYYGVRGDVPLLGDWDGDGFDTPGAYRPSTGFAYLTNDLPADGGAGIADPELVFYFGTRGDQVFVGDWDGDGVDTLGIRRRGKILLTNTNATSFASAEFFFGLEGDIAHGGAGDDWGRDGIFLYRPGTGYVYYTNGQFGRDEVAPTKGELYFGIPGDVLVVGDWDGDAQDSPAIQRPDERTLYLRDSMSTGTADRSFYWGGPNWAPVAGRLPLNPDDVAPAAESCAAPIAPLTGLVDGNDTRGVLLAKYSNSSKARPQAGINDADMVMEVIVEWGVGRWIAFFQTSYPEVVGPLRSVREVDPKLIAPYDARILHSGGPTHVRQAIAEVAEDIGAGRVPGYYREGGRPAVYDLMYNMERLPDGTSPAAYPAPLLIDPVLPSGGELASSINVAMTSANTFDWIYSRGRYARSQGGRAAVDTNGEPITATNVVVVFVEQFDTGRRDSAGSPVPDYEVTGSGEAVVFRNGFAYPGRWARSTTNDVFQFTDMDGNPLTMMPGRTWLHMTPTTGSVDWS